MPDSNLADNSVLTSAFYNTYIREQVVVTCTSGTRPTGVTGRLIFETDTVRVMVYDGSGWVPLSKFVGNWTTYTPTWNNITLGDGTSSGRYRYVGTESIEFHAWLTFDSTTVDGAVSVDLPNSESSASWIPSNVAAVGDVNFGDSGTSTYMGMTRIGSNDSSMDVLAIGSNGQRVSLSSSDPFTWTDDDSIYVFAQVPL